jgi:outer membrane scaffolding protein for murein synthesis (MipA/OmpV family)
LESTTALNAAAVSLTRPSPGRVDGKTAAPFVLSILAWLSPVCRAQTPSPLQEWQYSGGIPLERLFEPKIPEWQVQVGLAAEPRPVYEGARDYRVLVGPVLDVRYKDIAFASVGEGLGVNLLHGDNYRAGIAVGYDLGRRERADLAHLSGLGNVEAAPVFRAFGSYVVSKQLPLVLRADIRQFVGGARGVVGDVEAYLPLPGSSEKLAMFAGPSMTFADHRHQQTLFGVTPGQSLASGYPAYDAHGGSNAAGFGFSLTRILSTRWLLNGDLAFDRLLGSAAGSPVIQRKSQGVLVLSTAYKW